MSNNVFIVSVIEKFIAFIFLIAMIFFSYFNFLDLESYAFIVCFFNALLVFRLSPAPFLQLLCCYILLFPMYIYAYSQGYKISDYNAFQKDSLFFSFLIIHMVFLFGIHCAVKPSVSISIVHKLPRFNSDLFAFLLAVLLVVAVLSFNGKVVMFAELKYQAYVSNLRAESGLPEYGLILLIALLFVKAKSVLVRLFVFLAVAYYLIVLFLLGYRVQLLMAVLALFFYFGEKHLKRNLIIFLFFGGFLLFSFFGYIKETGLEHITFSKILFDDSPGFIISHHTGVLYSSLVNLGLLELGVIDFDSKFKQATGLVLNSVIPSRYVNHWVPEANMALYIRKFSLTAGGLYGPVNVFNSLGWIGVFLIGFLISRLYYSLSSLPESRIYRLGAVYLFCILTTFPRWISYDIGNFFLRLPIYIVVMVSLLFLLSDLSKKISRI